MPFQIFFPCALHGGLEGQHQHFLPAHFLRQLIRGKGLAKTHFGIPQKMRSFILVAPVFFEVDEIRGGLFHRFDLFGAHLKIERAVFFVEFACFDGDIGGL